LRCPSSIARNLPRPRPLALRESPEFARHVRAIRALFARLGVAKE